MVTDSLKPRSTEPTASKTLRDVLSPSVANSLVELATWLNSNEFRVAVTRFSEFVLAFEKYAEWQRTSYPQLAEKIPFLSNESWFIHVGDMEWFLELASSAEDQELLLVEVERLYRRDLSKIAENLKASYPNRAKLIADAVEAHRQGQFTLSIPVFFAQADGIVAEINKVLFSEKQANLHRFSSLAAAQANAVQLSDDDGMTRLEHALWGHPFAEFPIGYGREKRQAKGYTGINRNTVLHGEACNYGTEINSLKAFSLLACVASLCQRCPNPP